MPRVLRILLAFTIFMGVACASCAQTPGTVTTGPGNDAGLLYASNFGQWSVPQGNTGQFSWSVPSLCTVTASNIPLRPVFAVGTPITIKDQVPANTEIVTPSAVYISGSGCSITVSPVNKHNTFALISATAGLQEAINYTSGLVYQVILTPDWSRLGGTTAMITAATGNSNVTIFDQRTAILTAYVWNGSGYVSSPFITTGCQGGNTVANGCTGATTAAGANLNITGATQTGTLGTSSQVSTFPGTVSAGAISPGFTVAIKDPRCGGVVDGVTDDTAAWTACIALASANSGTVTTDGLSLLKSTPTIPSAGNFRIEGTTPGAGLHFSNGSTIFGGSVPPLGSYSGSIGAGLYFPPGTSNVEIDHVTLECDVSSTTGCTQVVMLLDDSNINLHDNHFIGGTGGSGSSITIAGGHDIAVKDNTITGYEGAGILDNFGSGYSSMSMRLHIAHNNMFVTSTAYAETTIDLFNAQQTDIENNDVDQGNVLAPMAARTCCGYGANVYSVAAAQNLRVLSVTGMGSTMAATVPGNAPVAVSSASGNGSILTINLSSPIFASVPSPAAASATGGVSGITCGSGTLSGITYTITGTSQLTIPATCTSPTLSSAVYWTYGYLPDIGQTFQVDLTGLLNGTGAAISNLSQSTITNLVTATIATGHFSTTNVANNFQCSIAGITVPTVPVITANVVGGAITSYTVSSGGANATIGYNISITDPTGTGASVGAQTFDSSGALTALSTGFVGSGYTGPTVTVTSSIPGNNPGDGLSGAYKCTIASAAPDTFTFQIPTGLLAILPSGAVSSAVMQVNLSRTVMATVTGYGAFSFGIQGGDSAGINLSNAITAISGTNTITVTVAPGVLPEIGSMVPVVLAGVTGGTSLSGAFYATVTSPTTFTYTSSGATAVGANISSAYILATAAVFPAQVKSIGNLYKNTAGSGLYYQSCVGCTSTGDHFFNVAQQEVNTSLPVGAVAINRGRDDVISGAEVIGSGVACFDLENTINISLSASTCDNAAVYGIRLGNVRGFTIGNYTQRGNSEFGLYVSALSDGNIGLMDISGTSNTALGLYVTNITSMKFGGPIKVTGQTGYCLSDGNTGISYANLDCNGVPIFLRGTNQTFDNLHIENIGSNAVVPSAISLTGATSPHFNNLTASNVNTLFSASGFNSDLEVNGGTLSGITGSVYYDLSNSLVIGTTTNNSYVVSDISNTNALTVRGIISDATIFGGSGYIPAGTTIMSINSGSGCSSSCAVMSKKATGAASGETIAVYGSVLTGVDWFNVVTSGASGSAPPAFISNSTQGINMRGSSFTGFTGTGGSNGIIDLRGVSGTLVGNSIQNTTVNGGSIGIGVEEQASNTTEANNTITLETLAGIRDITSSSGNSYLDNILTGNPTPTTITNVNAVVSGNVVGEGTGTPSSASVPCGANSVSNIYYQASSSGRIVWYCNNDTGTPTWIATTPGGAAWITKTPQLVYNTPYSATMLTSTSNVSLLTLLASGSNPGGKYQLAVSASEVSVGSGGTCTTQGTMEGEIGYTDADSSVVLTGGVSMPTMAMSTVTLSTAQAASGTINSAVVWRGVPFQINTSAGTAITIQLYQNVASNCTTTPVIIYRPELLRVP